MIQGRIQVGWKMGAEVFPLPNLIVPTCVNIALCLGEGMRERRDQRRKKKKERSEGEEQNEIQNSFIAVLIHLE